MINYENNKALILEIKTLIINDNQEYHLFCISGEELKSRYSLGSKEMQMAVQEEVKRNEREYQQQMKQQQEKYDSLFNTTLHIKGLCLFLKCLI